MEIQSKFAKLVLISLLEGESSIVAVARKSKVFTYSELVRARKMLEEKGLIESEKIGRKRMMKLTAKGTEVASMIKKVDELIA